MYQSTPEYICWVERKGDEFVGNKQTNKQTNTQPCILVFSTYNHHHSSRIIAGFYA